MQILYIGGGFVGACSAAVSADSGHSVLVFDVDDKKIKKLSSGDRDTIQSCLFEEGLGDLLVRNKERINFTTDYAKVEKFLDSCDAIFMCLPTPEIGETGESDLSFYFSAVEKLSQSLNRRNNHKQEKYVVLVNKSTVPIDMIDKTAEVLKTAGVKNFGVVSNPEFLVEGKAIEGSIHPDRVVVGSWEEKDFAMMRQIYQRFYNSSTVKYVEVNPKEAAAGKLLANFILFNKLAVCFDVVGRTCETFSDLGYENVRKILISEPRIGGWGLYDSLYAGGSCFIKDARSLAHQLQTAGQNAVVVDETYLANKRQLELFIGRAEKEAKIDWSDKVVAILGLAFKQSTNDVRNSPSIDIANFLLEKQVKGINCYDPAAVEMFSNIFKDNKTVKYFKDEFTAIEKSEVIILATDWPQFRGLADKLLSLKSRPLIMDGRRILQPDYTRLQKSGFNIIAVGSPFIQGKK